MSFDTDGFWDIDEQLRVLQLVQTAFTGSDLVMLVEGSGTPVAGESVRSFPDNKPRMDICGYSWGLVQRSGSVGSAGARTFAPLVVVRRTDAATVSLASLLYNRTPNLKVIISAFRAGGDPSATDTQPMFEIELRDGQITGQFLTTGGPLANLSEIVVFNYRSIMLRAAPQQATGSRGAVRECEMTPGSAR